MAARERGVRVRAINVCPVMMNETGVFRLKGGEEYPIICEGWISWNKEWWNFSQEIAANNFYIITE